MSTSLSFKVCRALVLGALLFALGIVGTSAQSGTSVAVIVHPGVAQSTLTTAQLRDILTGEQQHWGGGQRITVFRPERGAEWDTVLSRVLRLSAQAYMRQVDRKHYAGEWASLPRAVASALARRKAVAETPGALSIIPAADVDASVKSLTIEGLVP